MSPPSLPPVLELRGVVAGYGETTVLRGVSAEVAPCGVLAILEFSRIHWPVLGPLFRFYFRRLLPKLGTLISGVSGPYQYLPDSVAKFPDQEAMSAAMRSAGLANVRYRNFFFGAAALHIGDRTT